MPPRDGREVLAGRDADEVHVGVGVDDRAVSRQHVAVRHEAGRWWLHNRGRRAIRLPSGSLVPGGDPVPLAVGYTAAFLEGTSQRTHVLELFVSDGAGRSATRPDDETIRPAVWPLSQEEHLVMVVLGQRYLRYEADPQPLRWQEALEQLQELEPEEPWTRKRIERKVSRLRERLSDHKVPGLRAEEIAGPLGNQLNHNLIRELVDSTTIVASDLADLEARLDL